MDGKSYVFVIPYFTSTVQLLLVTFAIALFARGKDFRPPERNPLTSFFSENNSFCTRSTKAKTWCLESKSSLGYVTKTLLRVPTQPCLSPLLRPPRPLHLLALWTTHLPFPRRVCGPSLSPWRRYARGRGCGSDPPPPFTPCFLRVRRGEPRGRGDLGAPGLWGEGSGRGALERGRARARPGLTVAAPRCP